MTNLYFHDFHQWEVGSQGSSPAAVPTAALPPRCQVGRLPGGWLTSAVRGRGHKGFKVAARLRSCHRIAGDRFYEKKD